MGMAGGGSDALDKGDTANLVEILALPSGTGFTDSAPEEDDDTMTLAEVLGFPLRSGSHLPGPIDSKKRSLIEEEGFGRVPRKKKKKKRLRASYVTQENESSEVLHKTNVEKNEGLDSRVSESGGSKASRKGFSSPVGDTGGCVSLDEEISGVFSASKEQGEAKSPYEWGFKKGDLVWAKAYPYTWWPGWIGGIKGSKASVSFFGCKNTKWFRLSDIYEFEENFAYMSKMVCVKLSDEIDLALEELGQRVALGLMCSCWNCAVGTNDISDDRIADVKRRFEPSEMLDFVLDMAVSAWIDDAETVVAVRISAQVNAYRHYLQSCQTSKVDEGFDPEDNLDSFPGMAVNDKEANDVLESLLSDEPGGSHQEIPDTSSVSEIVFGEIGEPEDDVFAGAQEEDHEDELLEQTVEGRDICVINTADFSIIDLDEEYSSMLDNQLESVFNCSDPEMADNCRNLNVEMQTLQESEMEAACNKRFSPMRDVNKTAASEPEFHINEEYMVTSSSHGANHMPKNMDPKMTKPVVQSEKDVAFSKILDNTLEKEKLEQEDGISTTIEHETNCYAVPPISSADSSLLKTSPCFREKLHKHFAGKCDMYSPVEMSKFDVNIQSSAEASIIANAEDASGSGSTKIISCLSCSIGKDWEIGFNNRMYDQAIVSNESKLHRSLAAYSEFIAGASAMRKDPCSINDKNLSNGEVVAANNVNRKALLLGNVCNNVMKLHSAKDGIVSHISKRKGGKGGKMKASCSLTLPQHVSRSTFHKKKGNNQCISSDPSRWHKFYSSPLLRNGSKSSSKLQRSSVTDRFSSFPKSLHMKFPKDFPLPSKEELDKKFGVFGPLLHSRTKLFFYTGAGRVVFLRQTDADAAYKYAKKKNIFGSANVRFWFDEHENFRKGPGDTSVGSSCLKLKSCLKRPSALLEKDEKKKCTVRFLP